MQNWYVHDLNINYLVLYVGVQVVFCYGNGDAKHLMYIGLDASEVNQRWYNPCKVH